MKQTQANGHCPCGQVKFTVQGPPLGRGYCHCTICQAFTQGPYADISVFRARDVQLPDPDLVQYDTYRPPPAVQRGKCRACGGAVVEVMQIFPLPRLVIVPTGNLPEGCRPEPSMHVFYHSRVADLDDDLPKYNGYWPSQLAFGRMLFSALVRGPAPA